MADFGFEDRGGHQPPFTLRASWLRAGAGSLARLCLRQTEACHPFVDAGLGPESSALEASLRGAAPRRTGVCTFCITSPVCSSRGLQQRLLVRRREGRRRGHRLAQGKRAWSPSAGPSVAPGLRSPESGSPNGARHGICRALSGEWHLHSTQNFLGEPLAATRVRGDLKDDPSR
jgi:hypothetical protein